MKHIDNALNFIVTLFTLLLYWMLVVWGVMGLYMAITGKPKHESYLPAMKISAIFTFLIPLIWLGAGMSVEEFRMIPDWYFDFFILYLLLILLAWLMGVIFFLRHKEEDY